SKESYLAKTAEGRKRQAEGRKQRWPGNSGKSIPIIKNPGRWKNIIKRLLRIHCIGYSG
ncbi:unnamed protein product, partial [marine sediment metagenome]